MRLLLSLTIAALTLLLAQQAHASQSVVSAGVSSAVTSKLQQYIATGRTIDALVFAPNGQFFVAADDFRYYSSNSTFNANGLRTRVEAWRKWGRYPQAVAMTHDGEWVMTSGSWRYYSSTSRFNANGLRARVEILRQQGRAVQAIAIAPNDGWVIVAGGRAWLPLPSQPQPAAGLVAAVKDTLAARRRVHHVAIQGDEWILLADNWATSSPGFEGSGILAQQLAGDRVIRWAGLPPQGGYALVSEATEVSPFPLDAVQATAAAFERDLRDASAPDEGDPEYDIHTEMLYHDVPGLQIALIKGRQVLWTRGYGNRRGDEVSPVFVDTRFPAASMSKAVASAVGLRLDEMGALDLDEDLLTLSGPHAGTDLGVWAGQMFWNDLADLESITPAHLLSHMAGLSTSGIGLWSVFAQPTTRDILLGTNGWSGPGVVAVDSLGAGWRYSGGGYTVFDALVEARTGGAFGTIARDLILEPLGMDDSSFFTPYFHHLEDELALGHEHPGTPLAVRECPGKGAGGLTTTAGDYGQFVSMLMTGGMGPGGEQVLAQGSVSRMLTAQTHIQLPVTCSPTKPCGGGSFCRRPAGSGSTGHCAVTPLDLTADEEGKRRLYGLGVEIRGGVDEATGWPDYISHGGTQKGHRNRFWAAGDADGDYGIVVLTNGARCANDACTRGADALIWELIQSLKRHYGN